MIAPGDWRAAAQTFAFREHRIAYWTNTDEEGGREKPALLLIHGFPTSSWDWTAMWPALSERFRLYALDMLGFGLSAKPRRHAYRLTEQADIHEALLANLGVGEAHILAHDYGDSVAQELLARENARSLSFAIQSVCFLNGGLFPKFHRALPIQKLAVSPLGFLVGMMMSRRALERSFARIFGPESQPCAEELDAHWAFLSENNGHRLAHRLLQYIPERREHEARWSAAIDEALAPLAMVNGALDPISGRHMYKAFRARRIDLHGALLENVGHYPHTEAPDAVRDAFFKFHNQIQTP